MRFEVPQFIEVEDKIFGPLTWRQFIYLIGGGGVSVVLFVTLPILLSAMFAVPIIALSIFLAFHQINNRPFAIFLESVFHYTKNSKLYLWKRAREQTIQSDPGIIPTRVERSTAQVATPPPTTNNIASLARKLELSALEEKK